MNKSLIFIDTKIVLIACLFCCISLIKYDSVLAIEILKKNEYYSFKSQNEDPKSILEFRIQKQGTDEDFYRIKIQREKIIREIELLQRNAIFNQREITKLKQNLNNLNQQINLMFGEAVLTGKNVIFAQSKESQYGNSTEILIRFDSQGSKKFQELTKKIAGTRRAIGIFINGELISAPSVGSQFSQTGISGGLAIISGNFSVNEAEKISAQILQEALKWEPLTPERKAQQLIVIAKQQYQSLDLTIALENYNKVIQLDPKRFDAYVTRGEILTMLGKHQDAIKNYEKLIQLQSHYIADEQIFKNLTKNYLSVRDRKNAINIWERRLKFDSSFAKIAFMGQAFLYLQFKDLPRAINKFDQALKVEPNNIFGYWYRGLTHEKLNNKSAAINDFRKVKEFKTDSLLRELENLEVSPDPKHEKSLKEATARIYHIKSLACDRLKNRSCATENLKIVKKLLGFTQESEITEHFSPFDTSLEKVFSF